MTKNYDERTGKYYYQKTRTNGNEIVVLPLDEYNDLADSYKYMRNRLYRYDLLHSAARDLTKLLVIVRLGLACLLGLMLPILFMQPGVEFNIFYGMLFLTLVFSLFIPDDENDAVKVIDKFMINH